jgi:Ca2+-binding EF-hand superfamily protein
MERQSEPGEVEMSVDRRNEIAFMLFLKMMEEIIKKEPKNQRQTRWNGIEKDMRETNFFPYNISNDEIEPFLNSFKEEVFAQIEAEDLVEKALLLDPDSIVESGDFSNSGSFDS